MASAINVNVPPNDTNAVNKQLFRDNWTTAGGEITALQARVLGIGPTSSQPTPATTPAGAMYYDTDLDKPLWNNTANWRDAINGTLTADLNASGFAIFGNRPRGVDVPGNLTLAAATHNGCVLKCTATLTLTWNEIGDFACMVIAEGGIVTINGPGSTNAAIPDECCATLVQVVSTVKNVFISTPRVVVS